jgi:hypothetical protein
MQQHSFGRLPPVSALTLGGGGLGMLLYRFRQTIHAEV